jgi:hypothetical protein
MPPDYADVRRYLCSVGIVLSVIGIISPALLLHSSIHGPSMSVHELTKLSRPAQTLEERRTELLLWITEHATTYQIAFLVPGVLMLVSGLAWWVYEQLKADGWLRPAAPGAQNESLRNEAALSEDVNVGDLEVTWPNAVAEYSEVENRVASVIMRRLGNQYDVRLRQTIGSTQYDVILRARETHGYDTIIEVKYLRKGARSGYLREAMDAQAGRLLKYRLALRRSTRAVLLLVLTEGAHSATSESLETVCSYRHDVKLAIVRSSNLDEWDCANLF